MKGRWWFMLPSRMFFDDLLSDMSVENKMKCDIYEKDNRIYIELDVPGYTKEDIKIECNKGNIVIKAEKEKKEEENKKYLHRERKIYGKIERSFYLDDIDEDSINAEFRDGILRIEISKKPIEETRKFIEIK